MARCIGFGTPYPTTTHPQESMPAMTASAAPGQVEHVKVAIIGSGPAGWTAALYAARANLGPVIYEGLQPGGQLMITSDVENYPGFPQGVMGPELMKLFKEQSTRFGTRVLTEVVEKVDLSQRPFRIWGDPTSLSADAVIISTGASAKYLGLPGEMDFYNKGLSACATCDGFFYRGKEVAVIGGGDSACEEANFLTRFCSKVTMLVRRDVLRASKIMAQRALDNPKIVVRWNAQPTGYVANDKGAVTGVRVKDAVNGKEDVVEVQGVFMAIGHKPNTEIFQGQVEMQESGYIKTKAGTSYTNVAGVFACGDCQDHVYRQAITAAGSGCMAAIDVERWLEAQGR
jgi:thioredoxin reductase (NADPH)